MKKKNKIKTFFINLKKKMFKGKNKFTITEALSFMVITFALGMIIGGIIMYGKGSYNGHISTSLDEFIETYNDILNNYYQPVDGDELLSAGINGMVNYLGDPYSVYLDKEETESFNEVLDGKYSGIGAEITKEDNVVKIASIFEDSPADKAGLKVGDIIKLVDGKEIDPTDLSSVTSVVKGITGTDVIITIIRDKEELDIKITRDIVEINSVVSEVIEKNDKKIGYIYASVFAENTDEQFKEELEKLEKDNIDSLIIDLRQNSGGHLDTVTNMISLFIKKGEVIYQLKTKNNVEEYKDTTDEKRDYKIVVLIDEGSASASEVFTAALKEKYKATIIGKTSFGKGKVQKAYSLSNGAMIKYTYQEWLTPEGNYIDGIGIKPDIEVNYSINDKDKYDSQLTKAIEELGK